METSQAPASHAPPSLRERKKSATRVALRQAAIALISQRGLAAVTVEDIAASAEVSPRTFFNYFSSKEDAVSGFDPSALAEVVRRLTESPASDSPPVALRAALIDSLTSSDVDPRGLLERLRLVRSDPHLLAHHASAWAEIERQLAGALAERRGGGAEQSHYLSLVVAATLAACRVAMLAWCEDDGARSLEQELTSHLDVLANGLAEPRG